MFWCSVNESSSLSSPFLLTSIQTVCLGWRKRVLKEWSPMFQEGKWWLRGQGGGCLSGDMGLGIHAFSRQHSPLFIPKMSPFQFIALDALTFCILLYSLHSRLQQKQWDPLLYASDGICAADWSWGSAAFHFQLPPCLTLDKQTMEGLWSWRFCLFSLLLLFFFFVPLKSL